MFDFPEHTDRSCVAAAGLPCSPAALVSTFLPAASWGPGLCAPSVCSYGLCVFAPLPGPALLVEARPVGGWPVGGVPGAPSWGSLRTCPHPFSWGCPLGTG